MVIAKKFIYAKEVKGYPTGENFQIIEEELPPLKNGEYLAEAVYISVDPYQRSIIIPSLKIGDTITGTQVAKIIETKSNKFPLGTYIVGSFGLRTHSISHESSKSHLFTSTPVVIPNDETLPLSLYLGVLGMPGVAAYFGFLEICKPKPGETVVVSAAGGAVGSIVGQIAKIKGCTVIGITGSDVKAEWLKSIGFDQVLNYKKGNLKEALKEAAPKGVDCYFDNVGGEISSIVIWQMNQYSRTAVCGSISSYNVEEPPKATNIQRAMIWQESEMRGFQVTQFKNRWNEAVSQNREWINENKLKYKETITEGFENTIKAFIGLLQGDNIGKAIVKV